MSLQALYDWIFRQNADGTFLPMKTVGIILGLLLLSAHLIALLKADSVIAQAKSFPRSRMWGIVLLAVCLVWSLFLAICMDMGEYYHLRKWLLMLLPVSFFLVVIFVPEFLAVRALGTLMLLAASPVLHSAFLQEQTSRLLLPILAYAWIIAGMFLVGMPYLLRDGINWVTQNKSRWQMASLGGVVYGAVLLVVALTSY
jgi:hypothetical protein